MLNLLINILYDFRVYYTQSAVIGLASDSLGSVVFVHSVSVGDVMCITFTCIVVV